jgi:precorrin-6Y C5,15-methyltransferase (decarboxylating)
LRATLLPLLGRPLIGLFTEDGDGPAAVARFLLERGLDDYGAVVGEDLGAANERVTRWPSPADLAAQTFAPLNYLVLIRRRSPAYFAEMAARRALVPGAPDERFIRPADGPEVMTRREVRAVALSHLAGSWDAGDTFWDLGAGLGTVAVELAVLRPGAEVVAVEKDAARANHLRQNRELFGAYNVRLVQGEAPEALAFETQCPRRVFVGGSGGRLGEVLVFAADRLAPGGRLVATFVTLENLALAMQHLRALGWPTEVTEVHVARGDDLAGLTGLKPQRGVFIVSADKP